LELVALDTRGWLIVLAFSVIRMVAIEVGKFIINRHNRLQHA